MLTKKIMKAIKKVTDTMGQTGVVHRRETAIATPKSAGHKIRCDLTTRGYRLNLSSIDPENRSVEAVIATEAMVTVVDWSRFEVIDEILLMTGVRIPAGEQVPLLDTHDRYSIQRQVGSTRNIHTEGNKLVGRNFISKSAEADHAWTLIREGHLTDNSIGYWVTNSVMIPKGKKAEVAGRVFKASPQRNLRIGLEWEVRENSLVPIGADQAAKHRQDGNIENRNSKSNRKDVDMDFENWLLKRGLVLEKLEESRREALRADFDAEQKRAAAEKEAKLKAEQDAAAEAQRTAAAPETETATIPAQDPAKVATDAVAAERRRIAAIKQLCGDDMPAEYVDRFIAEGTEIDVVQAQVLQHIRANRETGLGRGPGIIIGSGDVTRDLLIDAMCLRAGFEDIVLAEAEGEQRADRADRYRDMSMLDLCRMAITLDHREIPVGREETIRVAFSTASLPTILGAIVNKSALKGYNQAEATWRKWCNIGSVPDFKTVTRARLTDTGELEEVGNSGEVPKGSATEEKEQYNIATYAKTFGITRQNIINDDMGVFTKIPLRLGIKAALRIAKLVYIHLLANGNMDDGVALFHADHSNLNTSSALTEAKLTAALAAFINQTDADGEPISITPKFLLVPPALRGTAMQLLQSDFMLLAAAGSTDATTVKGSANINKNALEPVVEPRLSNSDYTGYSATSWYVLGDPAVCDTIEVAFLNGKQTPTVERFNPGPDVMGLVYRIFHDFGCKSLDYRTMQKNTA